MIGFSNGTCRLCGKTDSLNEGICAAHSSDAAQGYLFGYEDGLKAQPEQGHAKLREALERAAKVSACLAGMHFENGDVMSPEAQLSVAAALNEEILAALQASPVEPQAAECKACVGGTVFVRTPTRGGNGGYHTHTEPCPSCQPKETE